MWIIGLLLLAAAVVVGVEVARLNDQQVDIEAFNHVWTSSPAATFLVGVAAGVLGVFGLWLMFAGMRRSRVRHRARREEFAERDRLADERRREIEAMPTADRGDRDMRDRERVPDDRRDDDLRDERRSDGSNGLDEDEAEHHTRGRILHRSER